LKKRKRRLCGWCITICASLVMPVYAQTQDPVTPEPNENSASQSQSTDKVQSTEKAQEPTPATTEAQGKEPEKAPTLHVPPGGPAIKESESQRKPVSPWKRVPLHVLEDQKAIWTSPLHTSRKDAKWWVIFGGVTAGLILTDEWSSRQLPNTKSQVNVSNWASRFGQTYVLVPATVGLYALGSVRADDRLRETGLVGIEALLDSIIVDGILKTATQRQRPLEGTGEGGFWQGKGRFWNSGSSFPSGHAIQTWTLASVIAHEYPRPRIIPILVYAYALGVNGARFAARQHFASDIVAGAAMGWFIGDYVYAKRHNDLLETSDSRFRRILSHVHFGGAE
jgi:membrane-associated phospholipid phosphatase